jgi:hypothetical protein
MCKRLDSIFTAAKFRAIRIARSADCWQLLAGHATMATGERSTDIAHVAAHAKRRSNFTDDVSNRLEKASCVNRLRL